MSLSAQLRQIYSLDCRSLALFRAFLGIVILGDLAARAQDLAAFYTDAGVISRAELMSRVPLPLGWSVHLLTGSFGGVMFLFILNVLFALMLIVGFKTRFATVACWVLITSLHLRAYMVLQGGDVILRMMLFWGMFLPLGAKYSLDARSHPDEEENPQVFSAASIALIAQVAVIYLFTYLLKTGPEWRDGSAVQYALSAEVMSTSFGQWMLQFPNLLKALTFTTIGFELLVPLLLLIPFRNPRVRTAAVFIIVLMQLGFGAMLRVAHFPFAAITAAVALLPAWAWDKTSDPDALPVLRSSKLTNAFVAVVLVIVLWFNVATRWPEAAVPKPVHWAGILLRVDQSWDMFAPSPIIADGWYVMPGQLKNKREVDVFRGGRAPQLAKPSPREMYHQYPTERWINYLLDLHDPEYDDRNRVAYARYVCREWNGKKGNTPERLESFRIVYFKRVNLLDRSPYQQFERKEVGRYQCP